MSDDAAACVPGSRRRECVHGDEDADARPPLISKPAGLRWAKGGGTRRGHPRGGSRRAGDTRVLRGVELGGVVARRRGRGIRGAGETRTASTRSAGDAGGAARMATWLAVDYLDFHGAWGGGELDGFGERTVCSIRSSRGLTTAGSPSRTATLPTRAATRAELGACARLPPSSGDGSRSPTWKCSVSPSKEPRWWPAGRWRRGCA